MALFDRSDYLHAVENLDDRTGRADRGTTERQRLSRITISCLILNRTIGSGIFVSPAKILLATGSVGACLLLWVFGGIFAICGVLVWLEFGLSTPQHFVRNRKRSVPRNGGEKNYLEYVYSKPELLTTCMFGIAFILLGNLSGNAYAFGLYVATAAGYNEPSKGLVIGIALAALSTAIIIHMFTRKGGIYLNNAFAVVKTALVLAVIVLGIIKATGHNLGGAPNALDNYDHAFASRQHNAASFADAFVYVAYSFSGFEQPFYVLSEFRTPRKSFPGYTIFTVVLVTILYVAINAAYYFVVPVQVVFDNPTVDIATLFFQRIFGNEAAQRAMSALIATSVFGNIIVMTFTASRVKQEIAKEGILPFSLFFATGVTTPWARIRTWARKDNRPGFTTHRPVDDLDHQEQTPLPALCLHWLFSVLMVAATAATTPKIAYAILVNLYTYVIVVMLGFFASLGLLILKWTPSRHWSQKTHFEGWNRWLGSVPAAFYMLVTGFLLVMPFVTPTPAPDYSPYWLVPVIGVTAPVWGFLWWCGLHLYMYCRSKRLSVERAPYVVEEEGNPGKYVQRAEVVDHQWLRVNRSLPQDTISQESTDEARQNIINHE